jgi:hypothetical protein
MGTSVALSLSVLQVLPMTGLDDALTWCQQVDVIIQEACLHVYH